MQEMVMVSKERWDKMMETYDALVLELEEMKKALKEAATSHKGKKTGHLAKPDTKKIIPYSAEK